MKTKLIIISGFLLGIFIFTSCDSDGGSGTGNQNEDKSNYYPNGDGTYYKYNIDQTDSTGSQTSGTRSSTYNGTGVKNGTIYQIQVDSLTFASQTAVTLSYFRKSDFSSSGGGVYFFLDTTGFATNVPPDLLQYLPLLQIDNELIIFSSPLTDGKTWTVFKINLNLGSPISIINGQATYLGKENININLTSGTITKEAIKIKYDVILRINPLSTNFQTFTAFCWYVADIGIVRWEGNATVLNALAAGSIDFADTSSTVIQNLIEVEIK